VKPRNQRLVLILVALGAMLGAALLAMSAMRSQASFFYAPGDVAAKGLPLDRPIRIGGMVKPGSLRRHADGITIDFVLTDTTPHEIRVRYDNLTPDLFREGSGAIAEGSFRPDGLFVATLILAKHDENYQPPELGPDGTHKTDRVR
jgi:cytochrome c-type biogenesis protein CcmE